MWWIIVAFILGIIVLLAAIVGILTRHNKYYFWKFPLFIPDRNGARKPGEIVKKFFGAEPPAAKKDRNENFATISSTAKEIPVNLFKVTISKDTQTFDLSFGDVILKDGGLRLVSNGKTFSSFIGDIDPKNELKVLPLKIKSIQADTGKDHLGEFEIHMISWFSVNKDVLILTSIRIYKKPACVMFRIEFPMGLERTETGDYCQPCLEYPIFKNQSNRSLVFTFDQVNFSEPRSEFVQTSAPLLFYNEDLEAFVLSPTMNFLTAWHCPGKNYEIQMGLEGNIADFPANFIHETILYADKGINRTMERWGNILLQYYQKGRMPRNADIPLSVLGYWTDAGTYYYYNHAPYMNYEEMLKALKDKADNVGIPYGYIQLDSWFYQKDDGTVLWDGLKEYFPNGIRACVEKIGLPIVCHNRWFSQNTFYKVKYPGWITETHPSNTQPGWDTKNLNKKSKSMRTWSFPEKKEVWDDLMTNAHSWGCVCYEQDWLQPQWRFFKYLQEDVYRGRVWLKNMADAAAQNGITLQYCMTYPSFYLETLELLNVTHARCADDYNHKKPKRIYIPHFTQTAMLAWSVGVWPWKDPFFTTCEPEKGSLNIFQKVSSHYEQWSELEFLLQVLSGGPVGNGDKIDNLVPFLLMQACREDGFLIKPDRPLFPIDLMFLPHHKPYICSTISSINGHQWHYILETLVWDKNVKEYFITQEELGIRGNYALYDYKNKKVFPIDPTTPIGKNSPMALNEHSYWVLAPVLPNGVAFFGLRDKIVSMSTGVFEKFEYQNGKLRVEGKYAPRKSFAVVAYMPNKPKRVSVNGIETEHFTWGQNFKQFTLMIQSDEESFNFEIEA
jgi:hypothetical protein